MLAMLNGWEIVLLFAIVLVLFGAKKLPELARGLGQGIKEFKKASRDVQQEIESAGTHSTADVPPPKISETESDVRQQGPSNSSRFERKD